MAEVLVQFDAPTTDQEGRNYVVRVCGRKAEDGLWEGWIEFDPPDGGLPVRTPRETKQPNRADLEYWATGLTQAYLQGALDRARRPPTPDLRPRTVPARPAFDGPAPHSAERPGSAGAFRARPRAILNPFEVYAQGADLLRQELSALNEDHLRNIIRAYDLVNEAESDLLAARRPELAAMIVTAVRERAV
jgi:hypothetical protein